jgi:hypothetical protein
VPATPTLRPAPPPKKRHTVWTNRVRSWGMPSRSTAPGWVLQADTLTRCSHNQQARQTNSFAYVLLQEAADGVHVILRLSVAWIKSLHIHSPGWYGTVSQPCMQPCNAQPVSVAGGGDTCQMPTSAEQGLKGLRVRQQLVLFNSPSTESMPGVRPEAPPHSGVTLPASAKPQATAGSSKGFRGRAPQL